MRCDQLLAVPQNELISTATIDFQKFRGINVSFANIEKLVYGKEIVVHYNPETLNKVVMIFKPDTDKDGVRFYHIEVEELWNPDYVRDNFVITNYVHAQYYPHTQKFNHIDFSVNQYQKAIFVEKYRDTSGNTSVPIDKYGDEHYKIWCVESNVIEIETWSKLVCATLDEPFRNIFYEMFEL